jgi:hypothetical protein
VSKESAAVGAEHRLFGLQTVAADLNDFGVGYRTVEAVESSTGVKMFVPRTKLAPSMHA